MKHALIAACCLMFGGCYITGLNEPSRHGSAHITIPRIDDHTAAVYVYAASSKHHIVEQRVPRERRDGLIQFSLSPGTHVLEIDCFRPNAVTVLHGGFDFEATVDADATYVLDCEPKRDPRSGYYDDNHFSLTRVEPEAIEEPPLERGPWLGCYDVSVAKGDTPMPLGTVRLTDRLEPPTAGTYEAHVVKSESHLVSVSWWPVSPTSFHLSLSDGYTGWSGDLEQTPAGLQGWAVWGTDTESGNPAGASSLPERPAIRSHASWTPHHARLHKYTFPDIVMPQGGSHGIGFSYRIGHAIGAP